MNRRKLVFAAILLAGGAWYFWPARTPDGGGKTGRNVSAGAQRREQRFGQSDAEKARLKQLLKNRSVPQFQVPPREIPEPGAYNNAADLAAAFAREERHPQWASEMEATMRIRLAGLSRKRLGLEALDLAELECRTSSCRFVFEYPVEEMRARVVSEGLPPETSPVTLLALETGPFASVGVAEKTETFQREGKTWRRESSIQAYEKAAMDPDEHAKWAKSRMPELQEIRRHLQSEAAQK